MDKQTNVTKEQYAALQSSFEYLNKELFNNKIPNVLLTFSRKTKAYGFFVPALWHTKDKTTTAHEIALNPDYFEERELAKVYSTLVHEMCHAWQQEYGNAPRRCYHNKQFSEMMEKVGLITSSTGMQGGKRTGQHVSHYIQEGGKFEKAMAAMPHELYIPFIAESLKKKGNTVKKAKPLHVSYVCPICGQTVKGNAELNIVCGNCHVEMNPQ